MSRTKRQDDITWMDPWPTVRIAEGAEHDWIASLFGIDASLRGRSPSLAVVQAAVEAATEAGIAFGEQKAGIDASIASRFQRSRRFQIQDGQAVRCRRISPSTKHAKSIYAELFAVPVAR